MGFKLPKLDKTMPIVTVRWIDPTTGRNMVAEGSASSRFQIFWQFNTIRLDDASAASGSSLPTTAADPYDAAQFQAVLDFCNALKGGLSS